MSNYCYRIGDYADPFTITRAESDFDRACDQAWRRALDHFQLSSNGDPNGGSPAQPTCAIEDWDPDECYMQVDFKGYYRCGSEHVYTFQASIHRTAQEDW